MAPKVKIIKDDIVKTALELVRTNGVDAINARTIATALNCSTQPIFSNFATMDELRNAIIIAAYEMYLEYIRKETESGKYPQYKSFGMAYIRFAKEEKKLFKLLFMRDRTKEDTSPSIDFEKSVEIIMRSNGISKDKATLIHLEMWATVHGIAVMLATSFLSLDWELISDMLTDVYQGVRTKHLSEVDKNECN